MDKSGIELVKIDKKEVWKCKSKVKPEQKRKKSLADAHRIGTNLMFISLFVNALSQTLS